MPNKLRDLIAGGGLASVMSAHNPLSARLAELAGFDGPIYAECAGLLYLGRSLDGAPMCGRLPVDARMTPKLTLGYRSAVADTASCATCRS